MIESVGLSLAQAAAFSLLVFVASALHRLGGQGFGTIVAPFAALIAPAHTPATVLLLGAMVTLIGAGLEFREIRMRELAPAVAGRVAGTLPAVWLVGVVAGSPLLGLSVALVILLGIALSLAGFRVEKTPATMFAAGGLSGFMGTLTSVGAAPIALIYQNDAAKRARGALNMFFLIGVLVSVLGLAVAGLVRVEHLRFAAMMTPLALIGSWAAGPMARRFGGMKLKPIALGLAGVGALLLIARTVA